MNTGFDNRPDPQSLLDSIKRTENNSQRGKLKIFFGMCAGVGKTYDMLKAAHIQKSETTNVLVGIVETHGRKETEALLEGLTVVPRRAEQYKGAQIDEMDLDAILALKPDLVLVDELAHTNAPGSRHKKRFQDVLEILDNGIDVYTTLNVQHLESRADTVAQITGSVVRETIPDSVFAMASEVELVDLPPDELLKRLEDGKVYTPDRSHLAARNFFRKGNLTALREMALRLTAERVDHQLRELMQSQRISGPWKSGQRLVVGLSASPGTVSLIRWARRTAYTMDATWVGVYVETSNRLDERSKMQLGKNLELARELGAEIVITADEDIVRGLLRVALEQNATQILVGKTSHTAFFKKSLLDRLIENSGGLDVYVVGGNETESRQPIRRQFPEFHSGFQQYVVSTIVILLLGAACYPVRQIIGYQTVSLILLLAVTLLPLRLGTGPVISAAVLSALLWNFLFIPPQFTFMIAQPHDILMFGAYFVIAAVMGVLTTRVRAREKAVRTREERAVALYSLTNDLSRAHSLDEVVQAAVDNIRKFFEAEVALLLSESDGDLFRGQHPSSSFVVDEKELGVAAWVYWNEKRAGRFTDTLPSSQATYFPLSGPRYPLGVIGVNLTGMERLGMEQETLLNNFIRQISSSLEREQLNELTRKSLLVAESERLYKNLFDSLSHEFKTPIAGVLGTAEQLLHDRQFKEQHAGLAQELFDAATRLDRLVSNLLDMTRVESGLLKPKLDWVDIADLISTTIRKMEQDLKQHKVEVQIDEKVSLLKLDFGLIEQALTNLLHNASVHTPPGSRIAIQATAQTNECRILVTDNGPGVPAEDAGKLFQKFFRVPGSSPGGTGLGLSIAKGFVEAHGGRITFEHHSGGGSTFTIHLPLQAPPTLSAP